MPEVQPVAASETAPKKKTNKKWLVFVLVLGLVTTGVYLGFRPEPSTSASEGAVESTLVLETFIVNLSGVNPNGANPAGAGQRGYLRVGITLGLARPLPRADAAPIALVRDTILSVLATAQPEDLLKVDGKRALKEELLKALQERSPQLAVQNVYFTEFLVQM
jgi:flagellar basal body-associated protein FliL